MEIDNAPGKIRVYGLGHTEYLIGEWGGSHYDMNRLTYYTMFQTAVPLLFFVSSFRLSFEKSGGCLREFEQV